jgi:hypothetical protein
MRAAGAEIRAVIETNSLVTLWSHIRFGHGSTVAIMAGHDVGSSASKLISLRRVTCSTHLP